MFTGNYSNLVGLFRERFKERVLVNEPLGPHVAYGVGGPADILVFPEIEEDLLWLSTISKEHHVPITILGTGTNLLVLDGGIRGISVSLNHGFRDIVIIENNSKVLVRAGGGVPKATLLEWAISRGFSGLEFSSGVPGTVGGGIFMNAGTKYGCYGDILREIRLFDFVAGPTQFLTNKNDFRYREQSVVKNSLVVWATLELKTGAPAAMRTEVSRIIQERAEKQPLDYPSCGSTFKNPEGFSAGRLIEKAGLKGLTSGGAQISEKHANFILNKGTATAKDILTLIEAVKERIKKQFDIELECEVIVLGEDSIAC